MLLSGGSRVRTVSLPFQVCDRIWLLVVIELKPLCSWWLSRDDSFQLPEMTYSLAVFFLSPSSIVKARNTEASFSYTSNISLFFHFYFNFLLTQKRVSFRDTSNWSRPTETIQDSLFFIMPITLITSAKSLLHYEVIFSQVLRTCDVSQKITGHALIWLL